MGRFLSYTPSLIQNAPFGGCYEWRRWCRLRIFNAQRCKIYFCCDCSQELKHYKDKKNTDVYRLFCCVSCQNKETVFRTRDANSAVNIRKLTRSWMENQTRQGEFSYKQGLSPVLEKTGKSKTIFVKTTIVEAQLIDFTSILNAVKIGVWNVKRCKLLPYYSLRREKIKSSDWKPTVIVFLLYCCWLYFNKEDLTGNYKKVFDSLIHNRGDTPAMSVLKRIFP